MDNITKFICFFLGVFAFAGYGWGRGISQDCKNDQVCYRRVEGAICADGTPAGYSVLYRKNATKLLIFLDGGGACWSYATCKLHAASHLSDYDTQDLNLQDLDPKNLNGWANLDNPFSPFSKGFNVVRVHYCTADAFTGDEVGDYTLGKTPLIVRHVGYRNLGLILNEVGRRFPNPEKLVFYGVSAGGMGVTWNLRQLKQVYPSTPTYVVNDGGLIFKTPYVGPVSMNFVLRRWGSAKSFPVAADERGNINPADIISYNARMFPDVRYALISSYRDAVMGTFSILLAAKDSKTAVPSILNSLVENEFVNAPSSKVFLVQGSEHVFFRKDPSQVVSDGFRLSDWARAMFEDREDWENVNPGDIPPGSSMAENVQ